jgi:hypothetical protein
VRLADTRQAAAMVGSVDNRRAFAVYGPEDFLVFHHSCCGLADLAAARLFGALRSRWL